MKNNITGYIMSDEIKIPKSFSTRIEETDSVEELVKIYNEYYDNLHIAQVRAAKIKKNIKELEKELYDIGNNFDSINIPDNIIFKIGEIVVEKK